MALRALLWDVDGTVAETEAEGHRIAFNLAFEEAGLPWRWDDTRYATLLAVAGGRERLLHDMSSRADAPDSAESRAELAATLHRLKTGHYVRQVAQGGIPARPGVLRLVREAQAAGLRQAVVTTTSRANVEALFPSLFGLRWQEVFTCVVCAEDAPSKKPDPQAHREALRRLALHPEEALALEDSPNGLRAATAAGVACVVTRSRYFREAEFTGAVRVCDDLDGPPVLGLQALRACVA